MRRSLVHIVLAGCVLPSAASAADATVGSGTPASCTEAAFDTALAQLAGGGTLDFDCGADPHTIAITARKTLPDGAVLDGANRIVLDGQNASPLLGVAPGTHADLRGLTLTRASNTLGDAGALLVGQGAEASLTEVTLTENFAATRGGAIHAGPDSRLLLLRVEAIANRSAFGGAIAADGEVEIDDSYFAGNRAEGGDGGALALTGMARLAARDVVFGANAGSYGGAVFVRGGLASFNDVVFTQNNALFGGGAIALREGGIVNGTRVQFDSNEADLGGAVQAMADDTGPSATGPLPGTIAGFADSRFRSNRARQGGVAHVESPPFGHGGLFGTFAVIDSFLHQNNATEYGGAISGNGRMQAITTVFEENHAPVGGALNIEANTDPAYPPGSRIALLLGVTLRDNVAEGYGGAIHAWRDAHLRLESVNILGNQAAYGGGAFLVAPIAPLSLATFARNRAQEGGALFLSLDGGAVPYVLENLTFATNLATGAGANPPGGDIRVINNGALPERLRLAHVTLVGSSAGVIAQGDSIAAGAGVEVEIGNSVVASAGEDDCIGNIVSVGGNAWRAGCDVGDVRDAVVADAAALDLEPLSHGNAFVQHLRPRSASIVVDRVACIASRLSDARGLAVDQDGNGDGVAGCDSGAIERQAAEPPPFPLFVDGFEE